MLPWYTKAQMYDGEDKASGTNWTSSSTNTPMGNLKIGWAYDEPGQGYHATAHVDELFFNRQLSPTEINAIKDIN